MLSASSSLNDDDIFDPALYLVQDAPTNLGAALRLAEAGLFVHPCNTDKSPRTRWRDESTRDSRVIESWWRRWPDALPAIDCGKSGIVIIDADRHGGPDGVAAFNALIEREHNLPDGVPVVETAGGGLHYFFRQPSGGPLGNATGSLPLGIDVRGAGYVIAPGATLPNGRQWSGVDGTPDLAEAFEWGDIPVIPQWLVDLIRAPKEREVAPEEKTHQQAPQARETASGERFRSYALAALDGIAADLSATGAGGRNTALNNAALRLGTMAARGWLPRSEVHSALHSACVANGYLKSDGRSAFEKTFASGFGAGLRKPANDPADGEQWQDSAEIAALAEEIGRKVDEATDGTLYDAETGEVIEAQRQPAQRPVTLNIVNAASLAGLPVPERRWLVQDMIPEAKVTLLYGDGGSGKSLLAIQLADAVATGGEWLGEYVERGRVLYVSCEDDIDEHHRRLSAINNDLRRLNDLDIIDLAGEDAVLSAPMGRGGMMRATSLFNAVRAEIAKRRPSLVVLDNLADVFGGDEINKLNVRQFVTMLNKLAREFQVTLLVLAHPSMSGMASGSGTSGNVAWSNSVRSRLFLERRVTREGLNTCEDDPDIRILTTKKSNGAAIGAQIVVRWENWKFVREEGVASNSSDLIQEAEHVFMTLLAQFEREGRTVSNKASGEYAPRIFAKHPDAKGIAKGVFEKAMNRLFASRRIKIGLTAGAPSKQREIIVEADASNRDGGSDDL